MSSVSLFCVKMCITVICAWYESGVMYTEVIVISFPGW
jgi:hypothetical protein